MSCTRLFIKSRGISPRLFMFFDRDKPFEITLRYKRLIPKTSGGSGIGIGGSIHITDVEETEYTKERKYRVSSEQEGVELVEKIKKGYCLKCGKTENCKKNWELARI